MPDVTPAWKTFTPPKPPMRKKRRTQRARADVEAYADVACRSNGRCELNPELRAQHMHHRLRRSQGGLTTRENVVHLAGASHDVVHANPEWSYRHGWLLRRGLFMDPFVGCPLSCTADHRPSHALGDPE